MDEDTFEEYVLRVCEEIRMMEEVRAKNEAGTELIELRSTPEAIRTLYQDYERFRNPENPYGRPDVPPKQNAVLSRRAEALYEKMQAELGADYQVRKAAHWF